MIEISGANTDFTSIIICAVNHLQDLTIPCIRSVIQNTGQPYELILIDDGSQDGTYEYFKSISRKAYRNQSSKGATRSRNIGLRASEGDYICFLDNDVIVPPGWLKVLIQESRKARVGIIGPILTNEKQRYNLPRSSDGLCEVACVAGACMLIKREVFNSLGYLDERLVNFAEDTDYCYRANLAGYRVVNTPKLTVYHRHFGTRKDLSRIHMRESQKIFLEKWKAYRYVFPVRYMAI